jgi:hypothetical protein
MTSSFAFFDPESVRVTNGFSVAYSTNNPGGAYYASPSIDAVVSDCINGLTSGGSTQIVSTVAHSLRKAYYEAGWWEDDPDPGAGWFGGESSFSAYRGCHLDYPSDYALTNGYVKRISVFAQLYRKFDTGAGSGQGISYGDDIVSYSGANPNEYHDVTLGLPGTCVFCDIPTYEGSVTITTNHFTSFVVGKSWTNSRLWLLGDFINPTSTPYFDLSTEAFSIPSDKGIRLEYSNPYTGTSYQTGLDFEILVHGFVVVVDWNWKHLNDASPYDPAPFTPIWVTNNVVTNVF